MGYTGCDANGVKERRNSAPALFPLKSVACDTFFRVSVDFLVFPNVHDDNKHFRICANELVYGTETCAT